MRRSFRIWGGLLRALGNRQSITRRIVLGLYVLFLITLILTVVPISAVLKRLLAPLTRARTKRQRAYFAAPRENRPNTWINAHDCRSVYITNTSSFLPNPPVDNDNMERILGQVGDRPSRARRVILRSNGIQHASLRDRSADARADAHERIDDRRSRAQVGR